MGDVRAKIALESGKVTEGCWNCRQTELFCGTSVCFCRVQVL